MWTVLKLTDVDRTHLLLLDSATKKVTIPFLQQSTHVVSGPLGASAAMTAVLDASIGAESVRRRQCLVLDPRLIPDPASSAPALQAVRGCQELLGCLYGLSFHAFVRTVAHSWAINLSTLATAWKV